MLRRRPTRHPSRWPLLIALLSLVGCAAPFGSSDRREEFPDAGPGGPDSTYAGIGQGVPFGMFTLPLDRFREPITGAARAVSRDEVGAVLRAARAGKVRVVLNLGGGKDNSRGSDGGFDLARWKARIDQYRDVDFAPYVEEGLILAHLLVDEPYSKQSWGGREISQEVVEEMARYSKSIWPTLPTVVRAPPSWLVEGGTSFTGLDIAWAQWEGPGRAGGKARTPEEFRDENVARAKQLGLGLIVGINQLNAGDGSSGVPGTTDNPRHWQMSAAELLHVGTLLAETPYACAFVSWRYDAEFEARSDIRAALDSVATVARTRGGTSCLRHDLLAPAQ
ncbi:MAG TPA: hypothetical protein VJQ44_16310 [Gemmatimonadales bacterium]|nr:hypothetical protein [Gemmatimonadales bacterium]